MNIERDYGITLQVMPYSNTSSVVTWFSAQNGRLTTLAKGAQRPRSPFLGQTDLFYTCEILYYPGRPGRRMPILRECAPLKTRAGFRSNWRAMLCASYAALLLNRLCPTQAPHPPLFQALDRTLDALADKANRAALLFWFELRVLAEMGLSPNLQTCTRCGAGTCQTKGSMHFSSISGGLLCPGCRAPHPNGGSPITPDILALLTHWQQTDDPAMAGRAVPGSGQSARLETVLGEFLHHHLDALYPGRGLALRHAGTTHSRECERQQP